MTTYAGQYGPELTLSGNTPATWAIATSVAVRLPGTSTAATVYTDRTKGTTASNPVLTGVSRGSAGLDTAGNLIVWADPGRYDLFINGAFTLPIVIEPDPAEVAAVNLSYEGLSDVTTVTLVDGYVPAWNAATSKWVPGPPASGTGSGFRADIVLAAGNVAVGNNVLSSSLWIPDNTTLTTYYPHLTVAPVGASIILDLVTPAVSTTSPTAVGTQTTQSFSSAAPTVSFPTGANSAGNLILIVGMTASQVTGAPPTGWHALYDEYGGTAVAGFGRQFVWWKIWASGDGTSVVMPTMSASTTGLVQCFAWSGVSASPIDAVSGLQAGFVAGAGSLTFPSITTTVANEVLVAVISQEGNTPGNTTWSNATEKTDQTNTTNTLSVATTPQSAAGASAVISAAMANPSNFQGRVFSIAPSGASVLDTITIPSGSLTAPVTSASLALTANTLLNVNIRQVGSTTAGVGLALGLKGT